MPYIVTNSDGTLTVTVSDNTVDTASYSLALVGRSVSNYGQYFAQNTIRHLENFASATAPVTPVTGQLWYDKGEQVVRVYDGVYWKRTGIVVGADTARPTTQLAGGGTAFFNTTNNKLEVHNGAAFKDSGYAGEVTSAYSSNTTADNPTTYGTRLRTLFLNGTPADGSSTTIRPYPVVALVSVKTTDGGASPREGITSVGSQRETIMSIWSDFNFILANDTATNVDGEVINYRDELVEENFGIAWARSGRALGEILQGQNSRSEYEDSNIIRANQLYVDQIGSASERVTIGYFQEVDISALLDVDSIAVDNDITANGSLTVEGDITAATGIGTFANLVVTANTTLSGITNINGNIVVNGVNTQTLGSDSQKIEEAYFDVIDTQTLTVDGITSTSNLSVTGSTMSVTPDITMVDGANIDMGTGQLNGNATGLVSSDGSGLVGTQLPLFRPTAGGTDVYVDTAFQYSPADNQLQVATFYALTEFKGDTLVSSRVPVNTSPQDELKIKVLQNVAGTVVQNGSSAYIWAGAANSTAASEGGDLVLISGEGDASGANGSILFNLGGNGTSETTGTNKAEINATGLTVDGDITGNNLNGTASAATYADLAEIYAEDGECPPGTVVMIGGPAEIMPCDTDACAEVFGVVSTNPAYLMNKDADGVPVALKGRVPVNVTGVISKGERLVSAGNGLARAIGDTPYDPRIVIGRALADKTEAGTGTIEAIVGVK